MCVNAFNSNSSDGIHAHSNNNVHNNATHTFQSGARVKTQRVHRTQSKLWHVYDLCTLYTQCYILHAIRSTHRERSITEQLAVNDTEVVHCVERMQLLPYSFIIFFPLYLPYSWMNVCVA